MSEQLTIEELCSDCGNVASVRDNAYYCDHCETEIFVWHGPSGAFWNALDMRNPDNLNELKMCA